MQSTTASVCAQIFEWVKEHGGEPIVPFSGALESKLFDMPDDEKEAYLKEVCTCKRLSLLGMSHALTACLRKHYLPPGMPQACMVVAWQPAN